MHSASPGTRPLQVSSAVTIQAKLVGGDEDVLVLEADRIALLGAQGLQVGLEHGQVPAAWDLDLGYQHELLAVQLSVEVHDVDSLVCQQGAEAVNHARGVRAEAGDHEVIALLGDGASLYGIQGLWTAAHYHIPVVFVVANNAQYRILKHCGELMGLERVAAGCDMEVTDPAVDFVGLARSFGVEALRVAEPQAVSETLAEALRRSEPLLIEVPVAR